MEAPPFRTVWVFSEYGTTLLVEYLAVQQICFVPDPKWVCSRAAFGLSQGPDPGQPMMHTAVLFPAGVRAFSGYGWLLAVPLL